MVHPLLFVSSNPSRDAVCRSARKLDVTGGLPLLVSQTRCCKSFRQETGSDLRSSSVERFEILSYTLPGVRKCRDSLPQVEVDHSVIITIDSMIVD